MKDFSDAPAEVEERLDVDYAIEKLAELASGLLSTDQHLAQINELFFGGSLLDCENTEIPEDVPRLSRVHAAIRCCFSRLETINERLVEYKRAVSEDRKA